MKQFKTLLIAAALFIGATSYTNAQSNVAHINVNELISLMPEMKAAQAEMEKVGKTYDADLVAMRTEYSKKLKQYESEASSKTQEENEKRGIEIQTLQQDMQKYAVDAQQMLQKKEVALLKPIQEKALAAINKVAKAQGFQYVLDRASLITAEGKDLLSDVKKELGL